MLIENNEFYKSSTFFTQKFAQTLLANLIMLKWVFLKQPGNFNWKIVFFLQLCWNETKLILQHIMKRYLMKDYNPNGMDLKFIVFRDTYVHITK